LISYGVYLYRWPIDIVLNHSRVGLGGWPLFTVQASCTIAVAVASYRWLEQPIRHGALSARQWRKVTPGGSDRVWSCALRQYPRGDLLA
jgi:peptidoglycan/LPS O-acetylase OafA/YrhL